MNRESWVDVSDSRSSVRAQDDGELIKKQPIYGKIQTDFCGNPDHEEKCNDRAPEAICGSLRRDW